MSNDVDLRGPDDKCVHVESTPRIGRPQVKEVEAKYREEETTD
jgi:hypothetical protein